MRIEGIDFNQIVASAKKVSYMDLKDLDNLVFTSSIENDKGTRYLQENGYRNVDIYEVAKHLQLHKMDSKRMIMRLLRRSDLMTLIRLLDKNQLIQGLRYFDKARLLSLMTYLPKRVLLKMLLSLFTMEELITFMPTRELMNIIRSRLLNNGEMIKAFFKMERRFLLFLMRKILGKDVSHLKHREIMDILLKLRKRHIVEGMKKMPFNALVPFVTILMKNNPELMMNMSMQFIFKRFDRLPKPMLMRAFEVLPQHIIINNFLSMLPDKFLREVATQLDSAQLMQYLIAQQPNLLADLATAAA